MMYIVKKGDTLYKIANKFNVTLNSLYVYNPQLVRGAYIYPGQIIEIPEVLINQYVVQKGDTLYLIAEKFSTSLEQLMRVNPQIPNPNAIFIGQIINLPISKDEDIVQTNEEYAYDNFIEDINLLKRRYPFIEFEEIGKSVLGKSIYAIRLGEGEEEIFYSANWHANEYLTGPLLMKFVEDYAQAYEQQTTINGYDVNYLFNNYSIWLVPMVNPDGIDLVIYGITPDNPYYETVLSINNGSRDFSGWSANIRGVDLNHQWPANWEEENARSPQEPSPGKYGGEEPLTEPEAIAIYNLTNDHDFKMVLAFHSQGRVIYWGFNDLEPPESEEIVNRFAILTGYIPEKTAYSAAGYKDWFIQDYLKPGYTVEVGMGVNPLPLEQFPRIYRENLSMMLEAPLL